MIDFSERLEEFCAAQGAPLPFALAAPPADFSAFLAQLDRANGRDLVLAVRFLAKYKPAAAVPALVRLLRRDTELAQEVAQAIATIGGRDAVNGLLACLNDANPSRIRLAAAYGLTWLFDPLAFPALLALLGNSAEDPELRGQAAEGLVYLLREGSGSSADRAAASEAFLTGLEDPHPLVRYWCVFAAGNLRLASALPKLRILAAEYPSAADPAENPWDRQSLAAEAQEAVDLLTAELSVPPRRAKSA